MFRSSRVPLVCLGLGLLALALILGALGFQYIGGYPPYFDPGEVALTD